MADVAARREARRKRILENSENRLKKIAGIYKESSNDESFDNDTNLSKPKLNNGLITQKNSSVSENSIILEEKHKNFLDQDNNTTLHEFELSEPNVQYQERDNHLISNNRQHQYLKKENDKNCDNLNFNPTIVSPDRILYKQSQQYWLPSLFFSPLSFIFLAAFLNILIVANIDISLYKGIITPYIIMAVTQLCLRNKSDDSQDRSMLVAALILCNIKPEIVHNLKKILMLFNSISNNFALYLTSFTLFNLIISMFSTDFSHSQFL